MKSLLKIVLVVALVIGVGVWYFVSFRLDGMIRHQIETSGSAALGTQVSVGGLSTNIREGALTISSITVANPPGFNNDNAFTLNGIEAAVDYKTGEVKRVIVDKPEIVIEEKGGETNFTELMANLEKPAEEPREQSDEPPPVIAIHHFRMNEAKAAFESEAMERYTELRIKEVELSNLKGTPAEISTVIVTEIVEKVVSAAAIELMKAKASEKMNDILGKD